MTALVESPETSEIKTLHGLALHFVDRIRETVDEPVLYDLGSGQRCVPGFMGVDYYATTTDVRHDLIGGDWSFTPDNSVDMLHASHFLEHVSDLNGFMDKAWRKLKDGGLFLITTPYGLSVRAWQDPTHVRPIFRETYMYFNKGWREGQKLEHYEAACDFDIVDIWPIWNKRYATRAENNHELAETFLSTFNAVDDITVLIRARKEESK